jgi:hypothetical protein
MLARGMLNDEMVVKKWGEGGGGGGGGGGGEGGEAKKDKKDKKDDKKKENKVLRTKFSEVSILVQ